MAYAKSSPPPCVHPIIQLITREWRDAKDAEWDPDWSVMSDAHIKESCEEVAAANLTWHKDLFAVYVKTLQGLDMLGVSMVLWVQGFSGLTGSMF